MAKKIAILAIEFYRKYLYPLKIQSCRFYPSCSQYAIDSLEKKGFLRGLLKTLWRILRCHPLSAGGHDPVK
ncbi:MAG: membrane protein insertion efficiency factor YidD [Candidatus Omnitrophica bacterium]|nr:membrane protein insertion efficiency factor YidD [Candidatus Omnitrophota bacterium]